LSPRACQVLNRLPDRPDTVAFMDGPVALAGLCDAEVTLRCRGDDPTALLQPHNTREWGEWRPGYHTVGQPRNVAFRPLYEIVDETYTTYFPIQKC
jgi:uncharacterized protein